MRVWGFLLLLACGQPCGQLGAVTMPSRCRTMRVDIGPEVYGLDRQKAGGSYQDGLLYGFRASFERIKPWGAYGAVEGHYGHGRLKGATGREETLNSNLEVGEIEARSGYTFQICRWRKPFVTPFASLGWLTHTNRFLPPVQLPLRFRITYGYVGVGFIAGAELGANWSAGVLVESGYPFHGRCEITNDPLYPDSTMLFTEKVQWRVELPLTYRMCARGRVFEATLAGFYRFRHFAGRENFPFDFIDTQVQIYGARVLVALRF